MESLQLHWDTLYKIFFNTIFLSFWEELFLTIFTLNFTDDFYFLLNKDKEERKPSLSFILRVFIIAFTSALLSNIARYTLNSPPITLIVTLGSIYILLLILFDLWSYVKGIAKGFIFLTLGFLILATIEYAYIPYVLSVVGKSLDEINNNVLWNVLISLPERAIMAVILLFLLGRKVSYLKANVFKLVLDNGWLTAFLGVLVTFDFIYLACNLFNACYYKNLDVLPLLYRVLIMVFNLIFPLGNIIGMLWCVYIKENSTRKQQATVARTITQKIEEIEEQTKAPDNNNEAGKGKTKYTNTINCDTINEKLAEIKSALQSLETD